MAALPRGLCPVCSRTTPVRRNGVLREHRRPPPAIGVPSPLCEGSATPPQERCSQCGEEFSATACGPTHALIASEMEPS